MIVSVINSNATFTLYDYSNPGTSHGTFSCNEVYGGDDGGNCQYDIHIDGNVTVYYNINVQYESFLGSYSVNYNNVNIDTQNGMIYCSAKSDINPGGQQYYSGNFAWTGDGYLDVAMFASEYAPSGGINVNIYWL